VTLPLLIGVVLFYHYRTQIVSESEVSGIAASIAMLILGWSVALDLGRALLPRLSRYLDPGTADVTSFLIRFFTLITTVVLALRFLGVTTHAILYSSVFAGIVLSLAAQQTVGNLIAGVVLLGAHPFDIGDRVRFAGFGMDVEGTIISRGLIYVTCRAAGDDLILVPNNTALTMSVRPLREPAEVNMIARLPVGVNPEAVQRGVERAITVDMRENPHIHLEEYNRDEIVMRIKASPRQSRDGGKLSHEILDAVQLFTVSESDSSQPITGSHRTLTGHAGSLR
jgi:small-conductance mechanosensitive channel